MLENLTVNLYTLCIAIHLFTTEFSILWYFDNFGENTVEFIYC